MSDSGNTRITIEPARVVYLQGLGFGPGGDDVTIMRGVEGLNRPSEWADGDYEEVGGPSGDTRRLEESTRREKPF